MNKPVLLLIGSFLLAGCDKPPEEQRLEKFRGSVNYRAYHFASEKATKLAVVEYNKRSAEPVTDATVHATIGLLWFLAENSEYSFVEADIAGTGASGDIRILCLGLQSIALSKMKMPNLSRSYYDRLKAELAAKQGTDTHSIEVEHKMMLVSLIAVGFFHGNTDLAQFGADALGSISQLDYLPPLIGAIVESQKGSPLKACAQLRELNKSEQFSEHKKALIAEVADIIENCPDKGKLGEEVMNRVVIQLIQRVLDDVFTTEDQRMLLEKAKGLPALITEKTKSLISPAPGSKPEGKEETMPGSE